VALQAICDRLGPAQIEAFVADWLAVLPTPLSGTDAAGGYRWQLSMRQVEVSRTMVFTAPRHARGFFEALIADNLDIGRPNHVEIIFGRKVARDKTTPAFRTAIDRYQRGVVVNVAFKNSRAKQYHKDGRALRVETVINNPTDLGVLRRLEHLPELQAKARDANRRLLDTQRVGQGCLLASPAFERVAHPTVEEGQRAPALRFGDPRVMALAGALCANLLAVTGITNRIRARVAELLGVDYTPAQMSHDLRRLRMKGVIARLPGTNTYALTPDGMRIAVFYTKLHDRLLRPLTAANNPPAPLPLRQAMRTIDTHFEDYIGQSRLAA